jgi:hypothetical protein
MNLIFRPLEMRSGPETQYRKAAPFFSSWTDTLQLLDREIDTLVSGNRKHTDVILQVAAPESAMRLDGGIRADAKVSHPGVIITFDGPSGPLRFATDRFESSSKWTNGKTNYFPAWQNNVRAIALALEALRKVDRYGVTNSNEQYTGFRALSSGIEMRAAQMTTDDALEFLAIHGDWATDTGDPEDIERAYRRAAKRLHPDAGGSTADFQRLQDAKRILDGAS